MSRVVKTCRILANTIEHLTSFHLLPIFAFETWLLSNRETSSTECTSMIRKSGGFTLVWDCNALISWIFLDTHVAASECPQIWSIPKRKSLPFSTSVQFAWSAVPSMSYEIRVLLPPLQPSPLARNQWSTMASSNF